MKIKQVLIIIFALAIASFIGYRFGITQTGSFKNVIESSQVEHHSPPSVVIEPGSAVEEASYIIFHDDETPKKYYAKNGNTGEIVKSSNNASEVINWAINALDSTWDKEGTIFVKKGTYKIDTTITIGKRTDLIGESGAILNVTANINAITEYGWHANMYATAWKISGFTIEMNQKNGHAIYSTHAIGTSDTRFTIEDITIRDVASGYAGIYLEDAMHYMIRSVRIRTKGTGLYLTVSPDEAVHHGNSIIEDLFVELWANNAIGVDIKSGGPGGYYRAINLAHFDRLQVHGDNTQYSGTTGVRISMTNTTTTEGWVQFSSLNLEHVYTGVLLNNTAYVVIINPYIIITLSDPNVYGVRYENNSYMNVIIGGHIQVGSSGKSYYDNSAHTSGTDLNRLVGVKVFNNAGNLYKLTDISDAIIGWKPTRNSDNAQVANSDWVAHGLASTPSSIQITPNQKRIVAATDVNSTHFQVGLWDENGTAITTSEYVSWYAEFKERV